MLDAFKKFLEGVAAEAETLIARITNKNTFRRVVEGAFLIAMADGTFQAAEKTALAKIIKEKMKQFGLDDILAVLDDCQRKSDFDVTMGRMEILDDLGNASKEEGELIMRVACFIGASDGNFDDKEKAVAREMASRMGLDPARYSL